MGKTNYEELYKKGMKEKTLEKIGVSLVKFSNVGDKVIGKYLDSREVAGDDERMYRMYDFETDNGNVTCSFGAGFDSTYAPILTPDCVYAIEYKGKVKTRRGFEMNDYDVRKVF